MLKRFLCNVLLLIWLLPLIACSNQDNIHVPVKYYYLRNEVLFNTQDGVICHEVRESKENESNFPQLLRDYLTGPLTNECRSPFPKDIALVSLRTDESMLIITLSDNFADLTGLDLTLACVCLAMTAIEITDAQSVSIQTENVPLDGKMSIMIDNSSVYFSDNHEQYLENKA